MKRKVPISREMEQEVLKTIEKKIEIYSFFPVDRSTCDCQPLVKEWKDSLSILSEKKKRGRVKNQGHLICPRDKTGMSRYKVTCNNCKEVLGYCWATSLSLTDWCDFHYVCRTNGEEWFGCFTPHISPVTEQLCLECTCGSDTRDFRANMTLPGKTVYEIEESNKVGRDFNEPDSKFKVSKVAKDVVIFEKG